MRYAYDIEVLKNFFSVTFVHLDSDDTHQFVVCPYRDDRQALLEFISQPLYLVGYNSFHYDDLVMKMFVKNINAKKMNQGLYNVSQLIIEGDDEKKIWDIRKLPLPWKQSLDLYRLLTVDANKGLGLKQVAINLQYPKIQDMPIHHTDEVPKNQIDMILGYNLNDVLITKALYWRMRDPKDDIIQLREDISALYGVDVTNASNSKMANILLEKIFEDEGYVIKDIRKLRTKRTEVAFADCIPSYIEFKTPEMIKFYNQFKEFIATEDNTPKNGDQIQIDIRNYWLAMGNTKPQMIDYYNYFKEYDIDDDGKFSFAAVVKLGGITYDIGVGGLHSRDDAGIITPTDNQILRDADVASYYPFIIYNLHLSPEHLNQGDFTRIYKRLVDERIQAKRNGEDSKAYALKITINSIFGKTASEYFWLEDRKVFLSVTLTGQLALLMLIERLYLAGIRNVSANTDGIICLFDKDKESTYNDICQWWQDLTQFQLEFNDYSKYIRKDVNNYISFTPKGKSKTKEKGDFVRDISITGGYSAPVVAHCLYEYFVNHIPIEKTLRENTNILDFCYSQKAGGQFTMNIGNLEGSETLQKNNRYFVAKKGHALYKQNKETGKRSGLMVGRYVQILNDYDPTIPFENYPIDYIFYEKEVYKIIDEIEPLQKGLGL